MNREKTNIISYFSIIGFLVAYKKGDRENCRFHLNQGLVLGIAEPFLIVIDLIGKLMSDLIMQVVFLVLFWALFALILTGVWVGISSAAKGKERTAPLFGSINILNKTEFSCFKFSSCHNHTIFSDGINSAEQMIEEAIKKGLTGIGISDHSYTKFDTRYCMKKDAERDYINYLIRLKERYASRIAVAVGIERDLFSDKIESEKYDYIIGSVHYILKDGKYYPIDDSKQDEQFLINEVFGGDVLEFARCYYNQVAENVEKHKPDVVGHFDLITKFGLIDEENEEYRKIVFDTINRIAEYNPIFEINTGAIAKGYRNTAYPAKFILEYLLKKNCRVMINADAHSIDHITFGFENAAVLLKQIGFKKLTVLNRAGFVEKDI